VFRIKRRGRGTQRWSRIGARCEEGRCSIAFYVGRRGPPPDRAAGPRTFSTTTGWWTIDFESCLRQESAQDVVGCRREKGTTSVIVRRPGCEKCLVRSKAMAVQSQNRRPPENLQRSFFLRMYNISIGVYLLHRCGLFCEAFAWKAGHAPRF